MLLLSGDRSAERVPDLFAHFIFFWNALHCICSKGSQHFSSAIWKLIIINSTLNCSFWEHFFWGVFEYEDFIKKFKFYCQQKFEFFEKIKTIFFIDAIVLQLLPFYYVVWLVLVKETGIYIENPSVYLLCVHQLFFL